MSMIKFFNNLFNNATDYDYINKYSPVKLRHNREGIDLKYCYYYKFLYSKENTTKNGITSLINHNFNNSFRRQSFDDKEDNIPIKVYANLLDKTNEFVYSLVDNKNSSIALAIDGIYNNNSKMNEQLNMGYFDITNGIPIDIKFNGKKNKNNEIKMAKKYIIKHIDYFQNNIVVFDRAYYCFEFLKFLEENNIKYICRAKWDGLSLDPLIEPNKNNRKYETIIFLRDHAKIIKYENEIEKTIYSRKSKKNKIKETKIKIKNDYVLVTNLLDNGSYTDENILNLYRSRWDIEVFFKHIKGNFKFQHIKEKSKKDFQKMYICELIIMNIVKIIELYYTKKHPIDKKFNDVTYKINYSNLINGIFDNLLWEIINGTLDKVKLDKFCDCYIIICQNKKNRSEPRESKTPFTKWYVKGYSNLTKYAKIIMAIQENKVNELNKNLKSIAHRIVSINNKKVNIQSET
jgi:hypothetical protein